MRLSSLFQRRSAVISDPPTPDAAEEAARARARRRLIGAAVLLVVGVLAFPLLFETQPRPVPVDIPMVIPSKDGAGPLSLPPRSGTVAGPGPAAALASAPSPAPASAPTPIAAPPAPITAAPAVVPAPAVTPAARPPSTPAKASAPAAAPAPVAKSEPKPAPKAESRTEPKATAKAEPKVEPKADTKSVRYVIQVGAFGDEASAKDARQKVERLGLKTYTQDVDVQGTRRIRVRVGPFDSQAEANKALAALKAAKLPGAVLTL